MQSMTGYGRAFVEIDGRQMTVEVKSVNHRFLDIAFRMPRNLMFLEDAARKAVGAKLSRGHVDVFVIYRNLRTDARTVQADEALAAKAADMLFYGFSEPIYLLLIVFWLPMMIVQFMAFSRGMTPYPGKAKWFCVPIGAVPALVLSLILGPGTALGAGIETMFLSFGNAFMFGGLLATLPDAKRFEAFEVSLHRRSAEKEHVQG